MTQLRHPPSARVRTRADFDRVFKDGRRVGLPFLALHHRPDGAIGARLGLAVSRKVDPHAVGRNRIKRQLREAFRHVRANLPPGDYVLVARPGASQRDGLELRAAFLDLLRRARALPAPAPVGTMPPPPPSPIADADPRPA
ncbi:ribonuclease P protein component [Cognatilysobacter lacus]|uniref:Ribonuclease P protein component n=1 Tax=Cognatilysobacter lacus TaxID=1643323 RepID=A0A5D8Z7H9_9GAMM|nr:ribonuclease P protein component [Lysobacter lacus]TZF90885.1 ribonuclease P protein component [Lysobacter lacus]